MIYKLSFLIIFPFFNFSCSSYVCLSIKDTRVIGLLFILDEYLFVTLSYISLISSWRFIRLGTKIEEEREKKKKVINVKPKVLESHVPPKECREDLNTTMKVSVWSLLNNTCIIQKEQTNTRDCLNNMHHPFLILNNIFYMLKF